MLRREISVQLGGQAQQSMVLSTSSLPWSSALFLEPSARQRQASRPAERCLRWAGSQGKEATSRCRIGDDPGGQGESALVTLMRRHPSSMNTQPSIDDQGSKSLLASLAGCL